MHAVKVALLLCAFSALIGKYEAGLVDKFYSSWTNLLVKFNLRAKIEDFEIPKTADELGEFKEKLDTLAKTNKLVIVDFHSDQNCESCKFLAFEIKKISKKFQNRNVVFIKVNIDTYTEIASKERVKAMPVIKFYMKGKYVERLDGYLKGSVQETIVKLKGKPDADLAALQTAVVNKENEIPDD